MDMKTLGQFIAEMRRANGMTQRQLAEQLGVTDKAVSRWERDASAPDISLLPDLSDLLGVTVDELLRGDRRPPSSDPTADSNTEAPIEQKVSDTEFLARQEARRQDMIEKRLRTSLLTSGAISGCIGIVALVAASICNYVFKRPLLGFRAACWFCLLGTVPEIISLIRVRSRADELFEGDRKTTCKKRFTRMACLTLYILLSAIAACLPLVVATYKEPFTMPGRIWFFCGLAGILYVWQWICVIWLLAYPKRVGRTIRDGFTQKAKRPFAILLAILLLLTSANDIIFRLYMYTGVLGISTPADEFLAKATKSRRDRYYDFAYGEVEPWVVVHSKEEYALFSIITHYDNKYNNNSQYLSIPEYVSEFYPDHRAEVEGSCVTVWHGKRKLYTIDLSLNKEAYISQAEHQSEDMAIVPDIEVYGVVEEEQIGCIMEALVFSYSRCIYWLDVLAVWLLYKLTDRIRKRKRISAENKK